MKCSGTPLYLSLAPFLLAAMAPAAQGGTQNARPAPDPHDPPAAVIQKASSPVAVDGVLNEAAWLESTPIGEIVQREPQPGAPASERTEVKLLYDQDNLYIGVTCFDSDPAGIIGTQMARDGDLTMDDQIELLIDPYRDRRNGLYFATNPLGVLVDGLIIENRQTNKEWDAIWIVRTHRFEGGWSAEFGIPFKSLSFRSGQDVWGFNISRTIKRKFEEDRWASPRLDVKFLQVSEAGEIRGFSEARQGVGLDIRPYGSGKWIHRASDQSDAVSGKAGGEVFYNFTPNLRWTTTFNTDFAETEVDNRQINLTRFPLFFPEKRAFFLENAGVFTFGPSSGSGSPEVMPFFSRRIGLVSGREIPVNVGAKLTGKAGRFDIGLLDVHTREEGDIEVKNLAVLRIKRNMLGQSYVGGMFTDGDPGAESSARTYGLDLRLATSNFLGSARNFEISAFYLRSDNEGVRSKNNAYLLNVAYPNDLWDLGLEWRQTEENFRPALGFVSRSNVRKLNVTADFKPRPKDFLNVRQLIHEFRFTRYTRLDSGRVESWRLFTAPINWRFNSGDRLEFNWVPTFERLFETFEIADGVELPAGDYSFTRWRLEFWTASKRPWQIEATWWFGYFYSGHSDQVKTAFTYKWAPHLRTELELDQNFGRLKEGSFVTRIFSLKLDYSVSPLLTLYNLAQFDDDSRILGWQSRVRWIMQPGNEVFFVLNLGWLQQEEEGGRRRFRAGDRGLAVKIQYTFRF